MNEVDRVCVPIMADKTPKSFSIFRRNKIKDSETDSESVKSVSEESCSNDSQGSESFSTNTVLLKSKEELQKLVCDKSWVAAKLRPLK